MKLLFTIIGILLADRAIPYGAWGYGVKFFKIDEREFFKRYGLVSFPRTLFGAGACIASGLDLILPINKDLQGFLMISLTVLFSVAALVDVWKARK